MSTRADAKTTVLIVSDDATAAALLGGLVETFGYGVTFATLANTGKALRQSRARACLLDCESDGCNEASIARVMMRGVCVVLVGPRELLESMRAIASRHGAEMVFTPPEPALLVEAIDRAVRRTTA